MYLSLKSTIVSESTSIIIQGLIERLQNGDDDARNELVDRAQRRLDELTGRMLKTFNRLRRWEDTSDFRQNASLRLWHSLKAVIPASAVEFFRLAATHIRRELIDQARHYFGPEGTGANHQSWPAKHDSDEADAAIDPSANEGDARLLAEWTEFHEQVDKLPDDERAAFDLLWYQELTQEEAAQALDISVWTLRRHFRNAKLRLHDWLGSAGSF